MKLKVWHRITLFGGAMLCLAVGVVLIVSGLQFNEIPIRQESEGFFTINRLIILLMGLVAILFALFTLSLPSRMKTGKSNFVLQKTGSGEMRISVQAIESIVNKSVSEYNEIKLRDLAVQSVRDGVVISMKVDLPNNVNIPLAVEAMQKHISKRVQVTTGIDVKEVRIMVESTDTIVGDSPFAVKQEEFALPPKPDPEEPEKEETSHA